MMTDRISNTSMSEHWQQVLSGDVDAFKIIVEQHQSAVSAVAYNILGDFATSQDVAQESFWVAWSSRNSLRDASRLGSWLCGIARNLARQTRRRSKRMKTNTDVAMTMTQAPSDQLNPNTSVSEEDQQVVWSALEQIPEKYREAVTLFYRQGQSIADVALAMGVTSETARQRLSRGRSMLKGRVSQIIDGVMTGTAPDRHFAARVIAAIAGIGTATKAAGTAAASTISVKSASAAAGAVAAAAKGAAGAGVVSGLMGGAMGSAGGLFGAWFGTWLPAQLADTETERQLLLERGRLVMQMSLFFTVAVLAITLSLAFQLVPVLWFVAMLVAVMLSFIFFVIRYSLHTQSLVDKLRSQLDPESSPNESRIKKMLDGRFPNKKMLGRSWTSKARFLGLPLLDIQISPSAAVNIGGKSKRLVARGWVAIGDSATGVLLAMGGVARGMIAIGGMSFGLISFGGLAVGLLSLGGGAIGVMAIGGGAIGWDAVGGAAAGWHSAAGGGAIAWHVAVGGGALAHDFAVGGGAHAAEVNTPLAQQVVESESLIRVLDWIKVNSTWVTIICLAIAFLPIAMMALIWRSISPPVE